MMTNDSRQRGDGSVALHHRVTGTEVAGKRPVLLLHGLFGDGDNLGAVGRHLEHDRRVALADLRNHGASPHRPSMSLAEMAADATALLDRLGWPTCDVVGHSLGGKIAMQLALTAPGRVARLAVADIAPVRYPPHHQAVFAALEALDVDAVGSRADADRALARHLDEPALRQFLLKSLRRDDGHYRWQFNLSALMGCYDSQLSAAPAGAPYNGPTLFIKGELSDYILHAHEPAIRALFPHAQFKMINGTGHWLHGEKPAAFNRVVSDFLDG